MTVTTASAAIRLDVTRRRVNAMIQSGRLPAKRSGREWEIEIDSLQALGERKAGRPRRIYLSY